MLKTASGTVHELRRLGFLDVVEAVNPVTKRRRKYVCAWSLSAFDEAHISLFALANKVGVFPGKLRDQLEQRGIKSIFEPTGRNTRYYRAEDVRDFAG